MNWYILKDTLHLRDAHPLYTALHREQETFLPDIPSVSCPEDPGSSLPSPMAGTPCLSGISLYTNYSLFSRNIYVFDYVAVIQLWTRYVAVTSDLNHVSWNCSDPLDHRVM